MNSIGRILVPCDGSPPATKALVSALELARGRGAHVRVVHVVDGMERATGFLYSHAMLREMRIAGQLILDDAAAVCASAGIPHDTRLLDREGRRLGEAVADEAAAWGADVVVVGTHARRGLQHLVLGSGAEQILRLATVPVLVVREAMKAQRMAA
ncbi:universal stress protein [Ramlibacter humi]|uniref:Universal stress protein n=1 Tax=Ramlibacter humi TaxID=2530451 RepID=A0A4Z0CCK3_9BURK|nr:universal stress protein [Ramlibacter humi]TFZ08652.1 universal stress protein [Ramlibacter humi]